MEYIVYAVSTHAHLYHVLTHTKHWISTDPYNGNVN